VSWSTLPLAAGTASGHTSARRRLAPPISPPHPAHPAKGSHLALRIPPMSPPDPAHLRLGSGRDPISHYGSLLHGVHSGRGAAWMAVASLTRPRRIPASPSWHPRNGRTCRRRAACTRTCTRTRTQARTQARVRACLRYICTCEHVLVYVYVCVYVHVHVYVCASLLLLLRGNTQYTKRKRDLRQGHLSSCRRMCYQLYCMRAAAHFHP